METYDFSPRLRRNIVVSKLSPTKQGEKQRMLSARKAVLKDVLAHTASAAALTGGDREAQPAVPRPPPRRLRSRQRERRKHRGAQFVQSLEKRALAQALPKDAPNDEKPAVTDITMETKEEQLAVLKLQAIQVIVFEL